jgi:hypothetical protein
MDKITETNIGDKGGLLVGKPHNDENGNPIGGIKAVVTDTNQIVEVEGNEAVINPEASKEHWRELSKINQSAGNGVPITAPIDSSDAKPNKNGKKNKKDLVITGKNGLVKLKGGSVIINKKATAKNYKKLSKINQSAGDGVEIKNPNDIEADVDEYKYGGRTIEFNPNHLPSKFMLSYAEKLKSEYPEIWNLGGNEFGNEAFKNLERVSNRGHWLDGEEWFYVKWQSFNARHKGDFRIAGVIANLKWLNRVDKGWKYMKNLIENEIKKRGLKKLKFGGELEKGIEIEKEHKDTIQKIYDHELTPEEALAEIAKDHLDEMPDYYSKLSEMEKKERGGKIAIVMNEFKKGTLKTSSGEKVTDKKQALAIALSEQRTHDEKLELGGGIGEDNGGQKETVVPKIEDRKPFFIDEHRKVIDNKNTVKIEKINKMEKSDIFYNPDIFVEEGDYVLGGFNAEDLNGIEVVGDISALSYPKLEFLFEKRLKGAIENFKKEILANITKSRQDIENVDFDKEIFDELSNLTETYLGIKLNSYETDDVASQIMEDSSYTTWTERIKERVASYKLRVVGKFSDVNESKPSTVSVKEAEYDTQTATLEQMLERLFNINEENTY